MCGTDILQKLPESAMIQTIRQFLHKERSMGMSQTTRIAIRKGFLELLEQMDTDVERVFAVDGDSYTLLLENE